MKTSIITLSLMLLLIAARGQDLSLFSSGGDYFESQNLSLSWSIGEPIVETFSANDIVLTQGFQQVNENAVGIKPEVVDPTIKILVYPNPTPNYFTIKLNGVEPNNTTPELNMTLYDVIGHELETWAIPASGLTVNLTQYAGSTYLVRITGSNFVFSEFIQKIK